MTDVWVAVGGIGSALAALFALGALIVAWLAFKEGGKTIIELQKLRAAATEETAAAKETAGVLRRVLLEVRLEREIDALREIAGQLATFIAAMRLVHDTGSGWHQFHDTRALLESQLAAAPGDLPYCAKLADRSTDPRVDYSSDQEQARVEIRKAIERAATRLAEA